MAVSLPSAPLLTGTVGRPTRASISWARPTAFSAVSFGLPVLVQTMPRRSTDGDSSIWAAAKRPSMSPPKSLTSRTRERGPRGGGELAFGALTRGGSGQASHARARDPRHHLTSTQYHSILLCKAFRAVGRAATLRVEDARHARDAAQRDRSGVAVSTVAQGGTTRGTSGKVHKGLLRRPVGFENEPAKPRSSGRSWSYAHRSSSQT